MSGHTPGPWKVIENGGLMMAVLDPSGEYLTYRSGHMRLSVSEMEANANLIAAAPDLLEALEDFVKAMSQPIPIINTAKAKAAIARAKGEA